MSNAPDKQKLRLIFGLGNPGKEYENTFHNAGEIFTKIAGEKTRIKAVNAAETGIFMNEIGKEVLKVAKKNGVKPENILIAHDDADIEIGKYKFSFNSGSAGHKGVESTIKHLGTQNFWRLRIGIMKKNFFGRKIKAGKMVLKKMSSSDLEKVKDSCFKAIEEISS